MNTGDGQVKALPRRWEAAILFLILLLAAGLRLYRLTDLPPGLHYDEGFKGVSARHLLEGGAPRIFFESDMGEEPLAIYLVALALNVLGEEPWIIRLPSALVGMLTVALAWWLGRELAASGRRAGTPAAGGRAGPAVEAGLLQAQMVGLGAALVLAILYWHLSFSRIGMEPILVPFTATLAFAALAHGLNTGRWPAFALAGAALGASLYTYKAGYFVPFVALVFVAYAALVERAFLRRHGRGLLVVGLVAALVVLPIVVYFATHPEIFLQRPASVALVGGESAPSNPWQAVADNLPRVLGMFFLQGDENPRSNLPGRPALDPFLALLFLLGVGRALWAFRRPLSFLPLIWLGVMVVPTLLTGHAPHFGRAIGATPAVAVLCATGVWGVWQGAASLGRRWAAVAAILVLALGFAFSGASTGRAYFHTWGQSADLFYAYDVGLARIGGYVDALPLDEAVYLTPTPRDHYTLGFLIRRPWASFDGRAGLVLPPSGQAATVVVLLREDGATLPALERFRPDGEVVWTLADDSGRPYAAAYHLPAAAPPAPQPDHPVGATLDGAVRLEGYSLDAERVAPGGTVRLTLFWRVLAPLDEGYTVFTHLLGQHNPATDSRLWAGHDGQPDGGRYPTTSWQPGETILDVHPLTLPADTPPGEYQLEAGLYLLATMARLPAAAPGGGRLPDDAVLLGTIQVGE